MTENHRIIIIFHTKSIFWQLYRKDMNKIRTCNFYSAIKDYLFCQKYNRWFIYKLVIKYAIKLILHTIPNCADIINNIKYSYTLNISSVCAPAPISSGLSQVARWYSIKWLNVSSSIAFNICLI